MTFYRGLAATASRLLTKFGQQVTVTRKNAASFDPVTGSSVSVTETSFTAYAAILDYKTSLVDGVNIKRGDKRAITEADNEPVIGDVVTASDGDSTIIDYTVLAPAGEAVIYELQLRY